MTMANSFNNNDNNDKYYFKKSSRFIFIKIFLKQKANDKFVNKQVIKRFYLTRILI